MTTIERFLNECEIRYHGELISKEEILRDFACEIERLASSKGHKVGIMLHTGSKLFTVVSMVAATILCVADDFRSTEEIVETLNIGDMVIVDNKSRAKFLGRRDFGGEITEDAFAFEFENSLTRLYPVRNIGNRRIVPYNGTAKKLNSKGISKTAYSDRIKFISYVWEADENDVSSLITKSFLFLLDKADAIDVYENTSIKINAMKGKAKEYRLSDIVTASYFTESKEYQLGVNTGKEPAVIMFYSELQEARRAIINDSSNEKRIAGLFAIGDEYLKNGIESLLFRQSTESSYYSGKLNYQGCYSNFANTDVKFWTPETTGLTANTEMPKTRLLKELKLGTNALISGRIESVVVDGGIGYDKYRKIRDACRWLKENTHDADEFVAQSFSFLNLLISAVFPLRVIDDAINDDELCRIDSTIDKINRIQNLAEKFWGKARELAFEIVDLLSIERESIYTVNHKGTKLMKLLSYAHKPQVIIVPKAYYANMLKKWIGDANLLSRVKIITIGEAKNSNEAFESVVFVCTSYGMVNPYSLLLSPQRKMLIYDCERNKATFQEKGFIKNKNAVRTSIGLKEEDVIVVNEPSVEEEEKIEIDTDKMLVEIMFNGVARISNKYNLENAYQGATAEISKIAVFSGGEYVAYFTKRSSVYRIRGNKVEDIDVDEISEGDILLFSNSAEGRDLFKVFMKNLMQESSEAKKEFEKVYETSLHWRHILNDFIKTNGGADVFVQKLREFDIKRDQISIRQWADEDSHIIGPHSSEAEKIFVAIGQIVEDDFIVANAKQIAEACSTIRSLRMRMLEAIKKIIVNKLNGNEIDPLFAPLAQNISKLTTMMQVERIKNAPANMQIPAYQSNKPIEI